MNPSALIPPTPSQSLSSSSSSGELLLDLDNDRPVEPPAASLLWRAASNLLPGGISVLAGATLWGGAKIFKNGIEIQSPKTQISGCVLITLGLFLMGMASGLRLEEAKKTANPINLNN